VADGLDELDDEVTSAAEEADLAAQAVAVAPWLLGADAPRHYFVAFVTPAELRGSGGFIGSWAEISAEDGRLRLVDSGSIGELNRRLPPGGAVLTGPEEYLTRYDPGRFGPGRHVGDLTFSPHFPYDGDVIAQVYPQVGGPELDGVISIDPIALAALLELTGPVRVEGFGRTLSADDAADFLLRENYEQFGDNDAQNAALAELVEVTFDALTTGNLPGPRRLGRVLGPVTGEGRIRLWSPHPEAQALAARLGADGALPTPRPGHDLLALASQNAGNNKIDIFQHRTVAYDVHLDGDRLEATARITIRNDAPTSGEPLYVIGNQQGDPVGTNRMRLSVYTPHRLEGARLDGAATGIEAQQEAGYQVYTKLLSVPPGGEVTLELDLVGTLAPGDAYVLDLFPHPTVHPDRLTLTVAGERRGPLDLRAQERVVVSRPR
jgi:hypothetical protein